jgi:hypothetical protein
METARIARQLRHQIKGTVTAVGFWTAVLLPFLYVPLLVVGLDTRAEVFALVALLVVHAVSLSVGYPYATDDVGY